MDQEFHHLWDGLQYRQEMHDRLFHSDIYNLAKPHRLTHLVLHQAKYVARFHSYLRDTQQIAGASVGFPVGHIRDGVKKLAVDGVIICLSMLNVCNKKMSDILGNYTVLHMHECDDQLISAMGQMAKTVEDVDHMAQTNPLGSLVELSRAMMNAYINVWVFNGDGSGVRHLFEACYRRLDEVERKHIFADQLQTEILMRINEHRKRNGHSPLTPAAAYLSIEVWPPVGMGGGIAIG